MGERQGVVGKNILAAPKMHLPWMALHAVSMVPGHDGSDYTYSAIPTPECTIILLILFPNNLEHTLHAFSRLNHTIDFPS